MSNFTITQPCRFVGCDVGKREIVVFDGLTGRTTTVPNEPAALAAFAGTLDPTCLVICEATGGYEAALLDALTCTGRAAHRADGRKVRAFIRSFGTLGKTDTIDARALARYGQERHDRLERWTPRDRERDQLHALVSLRNDLIEQRVACSNRQAAPGAATVQACLGRLVAVLNAEIAGIDAEIRALIAQCEILARSIAILTSIKGIAVTTATGLLALMPELGALNRKQAAALAGLAPHPRQSGTSDAYRRTRGGRPGIKRTLFFAALAAARHNPTLSDFYKRLIANGKKRIVALIAVMRKLVVIANAKLGEQLS